MAIMTKKGAMAELKRHLKGFAGYPVFQQPEALLKMEDLWGVINRVKEYVKTIFKPAKSIDELKDRYNNSDMLKSFDVSKSARLETCNAGFEAMINVADRFEMSQPLSFFGTMNESPFRGEKIRKNTYAVYSRVKSYFSNNLTDGIIFPVATSLKKVEEQKRLGNARYNDKLQQHIDMVLSNRMASEEVKEKAKQLKSWRWSVSEKFQGTVHHEMGHMLHLREDIKELDPLVRENYRNGWGLLISQYSLTNHKEYFAETFAAYMEGEEEFIEPRLLALLKELDKAA
ncbi:hypothetical protein NTE19_003380 [Vibrio fluvialis]|nr:hypothetical protein [Vibrio fluvialis]